MCKNVFSERTQAVKCPNFLGSHFVFLKCCEICTEAIEMPCANTFSRGSARKQLDFVRFFCILQFSGIIILALFDKGMMSEV